MKKLVLGIMVVMGTLPFSKERKEDVFEQRQMLIIIKTDN